MPSNIVKSFAEKTGKSESEVERLWNIAKDEVGKKGIPEDSDRYYKIVTGILKRMLKIDEESSPTITTTSVEVGSGMSGEFQPYLYQMRRYGSTVKKTKKKKEK